MISKGQNQQPFSTKHYKHQFFAYWGWNSDWYTNSDIHFHGTNYDFSLAKVEARDHQTPFGLDPYINPSAITIPQTNFRIGYFFKDNWSISLGLDHMKYVMQQDQNVRINGSIQNSGTGYDGTYTNDNILLSTDFLMFEHTDGLNYINAEIRRFDNILNLRRYHLPNIDLNVTEGFGIGALLPKSNTTLLGNERYDEFHLAGYGASGFVGLNITFFDHFFIQSELKAGYINMPDIRTTKFSEDRADQHFLFLQSNILVGANFDIGKKKRLKAKE
ncbi:MAG: hypothetical protein HOP08_17890 [Cyclobacteriaceae bacterium]|nr:hypothetical protein [Cyclobacteriaceae bacterium]